MEYLRTAEGRNFYSYVCEGCKSEGEIGVLENENQPFSCPEGCGATYIQWNDPIKEQPALMCVVCPVFDDDDSYYDDDDDDSYYDDDDDDSYYDDDDS